METGATLDSSPTEVPTANITEETSGPNRRTQVIVIIVVVTLMGLGLLIGGLTWLARRRRLKIDAARRSKRYITLNGEEGLPRIGMLEASIVRARYGGQEPSALPPDGQTPAMPPMGQATLVGGSVQQSARETHQDRPPDSTLSKSRSQARTETSRVATTASRSNHQRARKRSSVMFPKTGLPPYPGSPLTHQSANT
jgi:hypothetical protein